MTIETNHSTEKEPRRAAATRKPRERKAPAEGKEKRKVTTNHMNPRLFDKLVEISDTTRISKSNLIDRAVELLIKHYEENGGVVKFES
jgi:Ribbon-helix-helix domain